MNAYHVNFDSVYVLEDATMVTIFRTFKSAGLRTFQSLSMVIYEDNLLDFYAHPTVTTDKHISYSFGGQKNLFDDTLFTSTF